MIKVYSPKNFISRFIGILLAVFLFYGCERDDDGSFVHVVYPDFSTQVKSTVSGFVTDENDQPVNLATVQVGQATISTDKYGYFEVKNADVIQNAAVVTVTKSGYFKGIKTYIAEEGKPAFFRIKLLPKNNAGTINAGTGGSITLVNGLSIVLPASAVVNAASGTAYSGTVKVAAQWLNPTANDLANTMPGDLRGLNSSGKLQLLTTYGMAAVELTGSSGELLQIAPGKKAILNIPIPASFTASAPASIPLWYFDEAKGLWKEEGSATRNGSNYTGEVNHFSFWNVDVPENFVQLSATVINDRNNQPVQNARVKISVVGNPNNYRYGYTNAYGYVSGAVPANSQLLFEVYSSGNCSTLLYSRNVTTTTVNVSLGTVFIFLSNNYLAIINGTVVNCSNTPVTNGYVMLYGNGLYNRIELNSSGTFSAVLPLCNSSPLPVTLTAEDISTNMTSGPVTANVSPGNNTIPPVQVCTALQEYVVLTKNGITSTYRYLQLTTGGSTSYGVFFYLDPAMTIPAGHLQIIKTGIAVGSLQELFTISTGSINMTIVNPPVNVTITEYGAVGQYMAGNFSGNFLQPPSNTPYAISCNFRIKRTF